MVGTLVTFLFASNKELEMCWIFVLSRIDGASFDKDGTFY